MPDAAMPDARSACRSGAPVNAQITRVFGLLVVLFGMLVVFTSRWAVIEAESLEDNTANRRPLLEEQRVPRGLIVASDGTRLAANVRRGQGPTLRYTRTYPHGALFSHAVGYSFVTRGRAGLEKSRNDALTGARDEFSSLLDELAAERREGDHLRTTLDPDGQRAARRALGGRRGSVVAIEPSTGRIRVMVSVPDFDPNEVPRRFRELNAGPGSPLFNRATQARYAPGSTFKVVTAAAALDTGRYTPYSIVDGRNNKPISGVPLQNFGGASFGPVTLTQALTHSVNTVWAEVGENLGKDTMYRYMKRFGFNAGPPLDYPREQLTPSGVFGRRGVLDAGDLVDIGRVAIGQERLQVTPLQMAMVAAAVGNRGSLMRPRLVERVTRPDGRVREPFDRDEQDQVMRPATADALGGMMSKVVEEGSGTAAALQGTGVAGKTGTAERGGGTNQAWFIAFAPVQHPRMAIAVTVENAGADGTGGEVAAPIARSVLGALLGTKGDAPSRPPAAGGF